MYSSYIYEIKIMRRNILPLSLNEILFCLTSQASKRKTNCCNLAERKFWERRKIQQNKQTTKKLFLGHYPFHCPLHHDAQLWNVVELEERKYFSSSAWKQHRSFLKELGKATEWFLSVIDSRWTFLLHILLQGIWHLVSWHGLSTIKFSPWCCLFILHQFN